MENNFKYYENVCDVLANYKCYGELKGMIIEQVCLNILSKISAISCNDFQVARYYYPHMSEIQGKRIVIYGAGVVGKDYYAQISRYTDCHIVAWTDAYVEKYDYSYIRLCDVNKLREMDFDILIIAVKSEKVANEIRNELMHRGVEENKICWSVPEPYKLRRNNY